MVPRRPEGVSGSVAMAIRAGTALPRGCSLEYPPSCLFSAILSSPFFLLSATSLFLSRFLSLSLRFFLSFFRYCCPSHFSPPYTYVFTRPSSLRPPLRPVPLPLSLSFASFIPRLTLQWWQRWWLLSPFLSSSSTSNRPPRDFISSRRV